MVEATASESARDKVSREDLEHLYVSLEKVKNDPQKALNILKLIDKYEIDAVQLKEVRIAKVT